VQASQHLLKASTDKLHEPFGSDEAMLRDVAEDFEIALGELK
jgi:hypothetical protein